MTPDTHQTLRKWSITHRLTATHLNFSLFLVCFSDEESAALRPCSVVHSSQRSSSSLLCTFQWESSIFFTHRLCSSWWINFCCSLWAGAVGGAVEERKDCTRKSDCEKNNPSVLKKYSDKDCLECFSGWCDFCKSDLPPPFLSGLDFTIQRHYCINICSLGNLQCNW